MNTTCYGFAELETTAREARFYFDYNPITGAFSVSNRTLSYYDPRAPKKKTISKVGKYKVVEWLGRSIQVHRLAWLMYYGYYSQLVIDHIDRNPENIAINNLREVTYAQNSQNRKTFSSNKLGIPGVSKRGSRFVSRIIANGELVYLGSFSTSEEASAAYEEAKLKYHIKPEDRPFGNKLPFDYWYMFDDDPLEDKIGRHMSIKSDLMRRGIAPLSDDPDVLRWTPF